MSHRLPFLSPSSYIPRWRSGSQAASYHHNTLGQWQDPTAMVSLTFLILAAAVFTPCLAARWGIGIDFPDPSITFDPQTSHWFTFATQGNGKNIQAARSTDLHGEWVLLDDVDLLLVPGGWVDATRPDIWAPDVQYIN